VTKEENSIYLYIPMNSRRSFAPIRRKQPGSTNIIIPLFILVVVSAAGFTSYTIWRKTTEYASKIQPKSPVLRDTTKNPLFPPNSTPLRNQKVKSTTIPLYSLFYS
jgi:hypothetical protein